MRRVCPESAQSQFAGVAELRSKVLLRSETTRRIRQCLPLRLPVDETDSMPSVRRWHDLRLPFLQRLKSLASMAPLASTFRAIRSMAATGRCENAERKDFLSLAESLLAATERGQADSRSATSPAAMCAVATFALMATHWISEFRELPIRDHHSLHLELQPRR